MTQTLQYTATVIFGLAILHTFMASTFQKLAHSRPANSMSGNFLHVLGEVEAVFGIWAAIFIGAIVFLSGSTDAIDYLHTIDFTEPAFVFVIMAVSATRSIRSIC